MLDGLELEIGEAATVVEERRRDAEAALGAVFAVTARDIAAPLRAWVRGEMARQHARFTRLPLARVTELKAAVEALVAALPGVVTAAWDHDALWAHRRGWAPTARTPFYGYRVHPNGRGPYAEGAGIADRLDAALRTRLGAVLAPYGFDLADAPAPAFPWTPAMNAAMNEYSAILEALRAAQAALADLRERDGRRQAEALWDRA